MTPRIKHCVERATHYREGILQEISKQKTADNSDRSRVATAFINMAAGDFKAILTEIGNDNNGPALKLFRFLYEDVINALWIQSFATDELIKELLHGQNGQVPGYMKDRAKELDTIFTPPPTVQPKETLFVDIQGQLWKAACSYAHGGSLAINRELAGHDEESLYEVLRTSTNLFILLMNGMYELHHNHKPNDVLRGLANSFFAEKW
ncbi:MAG: hypothetical protein WCA19_22705 [Candidatus Acidiferrales bacterium]